MDFENNEINNMLPPPGKYPDMNMIEQDPGYQAWKHIPQFAQEYAEILSKEAVLGNLRSKESHDYVDLKLRLASYLNKFTCKVIDHCELDDNGTILILTKAQALKLPDIDKKRVKVVYADEKERFMIKSVHRMLSGANTRLSISRSINGFEQEMERTLIERKNKTIADETRRSGFFGTKPKSTWKEAEQYKYD